jgi:signal transduction histidine kinase
MGALSAPETLRGSLARLFLIAGLVMTVVVAAGVLAVVRLGQDRTAVISRVDPANLLVAQLLTAYVDQETGIRGYVLTRSPSFLQPYQQGQADANATTASLARLLPTRSRAGELLARAQHAADAWETQFARPALAATRAGDARYATDPAQAQGKSLLDTFREDVTALQADLGREQAVAKHRLAVSADVLVGVLIAAAAVLTLTAVAIWRSLRRRVIAPLSAVGEDARIVAGGELTHEVRITGPPEVADLASGVEAMRKRILADVDAERESQCQLTELNADLARSNQDLEQFAYVASHDLQEPLRKITSFCQLLQQRYAGQLDERADQYIGFAVDGAKRMQVLINDLLILSRIGRTTGHFEPVSLQACLELAERNLAERIDETGAEVEADGELPTVDGDRALLVSLLQNLVGNAIKFHSDALPVVRLSASHQDGDWVITVQDNGIGIEPRFAEKIFVIFQRLHGRDAYGGTGIGLAICKKIVEFHGGSIWLDVAYHPGARFHFTLPVLTEEVPVDESG